MGSLGSGLAHLHMKGLLLGRVIYYAWEGQSLQRRQRIRITENKRARFIHL